MAIKFEVKTRQKRNKAGKTIYQYYFYGPQINGKRKEYSKSGFTTNKEARIAGENALAELIGKGFKTNDELGNTSFDDFVYNVWFPGKSSAKNWQWKTTEGYKKRIKNNVLPYLGGYPLKGLTPGVIQSGINHMFYERGLSINSVSDTHGLIVNILKYAVDLGYIDKSPMNLVSVPKVDNYDEEDELGIYAQTRDIISQEALDRIFARFPVGTSFHIPAMLALYASMRLGEAFGITWNDIDFDNNVIHIRRQMQWIDGFWCLTNPKYNSRRDIPLCNRLKSALLEEKKLQSSYNIIYKYYIKKAPDGEIKNTHGVYDIFCDYGEGCEEVHFVNINPDGSFRNPNILQHASAVIHGRANKKVTEPLCDDFNFHSLRHTFSSRMIIQEVTPMYVSQLMGHKDKEGMNRTTARYVHIPFEKLEEFTEQINNIYIPEEEREW